MVRSKSPALCINDVLPHHLLTEVLVRLPSIDLIRCTSVCKLWLSCRENDPDIVGRSILRKEDEEQDNQLIQVEWNPSEMVMLTPTCYCVDASQFSLDFLPIFDDLFHYGRSLSYSVVDSSNGLLLCIRRIINDERYCICNPITKQWFELPKFTPCSRDRDVQVGFFSDPFYQVDDDYNSSITINHEFAVKVVILDLCRYNEDDTVSDLDVEMYSSKTGCWTTSRLQLPEHVMGKLDPFYHGPMVPYKGKLYWIVEEGYELLIYDTDTDEFVMDRLDLPYGDEENIDDVVPFKGLSLSRGLLFMAQGRGTRLRLHMLADDDEWYLFHDVDFINDFQCDSRLVKDPSTWMSVDRNHFYAVHPNDPSAGFVATENMLLEYDFQIGTMTVIIENVDDEDSDFDRFYALPVSLPIWPTPLPRLPGA
ncbi:hypothetical protein LINPERHAP1_LOCUS1117 [Linum perenne]